MFIFFGAFMVKLSLNLIDKITKGLLLMGISTLIPLSLRSSRKETKLCKLEKQIKGTASV